MEITLYSSTADPRVLNKSTQLTPIAKVQAKVYFPFNILAPTFSIKYTASLVGANYCYIPYLGRYYFLNEPVLESGEIISFSGSVDPLMSYKSQIVNLDCICLTSQYDYNEYIPHDIPSSAKATITNYRFGNFSFSLPTSDSDVQYVLTLNGLVGEVDE